MHGIAQQCGNRQTPLRAAGPLLLDSEISQDHIAPANSSSPLKVAALLRVSSVPDIQSERRASFLLVVSMVTRAVFGLMTVRAKSSGSSSHLPCISFCIVEGQDRKRCSYLLR